MTGVDPPGGGTAPAGSVPPEPPSETLLARAAWSRLAEPGDLVAGALVAALGPVDALAWLQRTVARGDLTAPGGLPRSPAAGDGSIRRRLAGAVDRWAPRLQNLDPRRELRVLERLGGTLLVPESPRWPGRMADLGAAMPLCLWVLGAAEVDTLLDRSVALIGARACSAYGEHVAGEIATGLVDRGWAVVSGGAYGIDAVAHRCTVAAGGRTVAFLAGGVDRPYPAGNARLLRAVADAGAVVSEVPPGSVPSKVRFLHRNRLIAAAARGTVVVEAAWRSGALSTAGHATRLLRAVGAVPGPVTSATSAGCHRLLREGQAVCVTDAAEVLDLVGECGEHLAPGVAVPSRPEDGLPDEMRRVLDALPVRRRADVEAVSRAAGLGPGQVSSALGHLELLGLASCTDGGWCRSHR